MLTTGSDNQVGTTREEEVYLSAISSPRLLTALHKSAVEARRISSAVQPHTHVGGQLGTVAPCVLDELKSATRFAHTVLIAQYLYIHKYKRGASLRL